MENIIEIINNLSEDEVKEMLVSNIESTHTLVEWPDSQDLMEMDWFLDEAVLSDESSYFVPTWRLFE